MEWCGQEISLGYPTENCLSTPEEFLEMAESSAAVLSSETQAMLIRIGPGPGATPTMFEIPFLQTPRIHLSGPPLSAETEVKIARAINVTDEDTALIEAELELALDILDSSEEVATLSHRAGEHDPAESAAPTNTAADGTVTLSAHKPANHLPIVFVVRKTHSSQLPLWSGGNDAEIFLQDVDGSFNVITLNRPMFQIKPAQIVQLRGKPKQIVLHRQPVRV
ncbi:hypothetical protein B0H14DRAFT_2576216 [Mycena olivaceomarginata]|nr:hypothetical protein B0H14DRAFT_2576216 [Mycena olivaceomarginata]